MATPGWTSSALPASGASAGRDQLGIVGTKRAHDLPGQRALEWLDALAETWHKTDLVED